jgi:hypothetical protein
VNALTKLLTAEFIGTFALTFAGVGAARATNHPGSPDDMRRNAADTALDCIYSRRRGGSYPSFGYFQRDVRFR